MAHSKAGLAKGVVFLLVIIAAIAYVGVQAEKKKMAEAADELERQRTAQQFIDESVANKSVLVANINFLINENKKHEAMIEAEKYKHVDLDFNTVYETAYELHTIDVLRLLPEKQHKLNLELYTSLSKIRPDNKKYLQKVEFYKGKVAEDFLAEAKRIQLNNAKERRIQMIERQFSPFDGSHSKLEDYIIRRMNDPDSYEHLRTTYEDHDIYVLVETTFRGKNAFGGKVINTIRAKADDSTGRILAIVED